MTGPSFVSSVCAPGAMDELGGKVIQMGESSTNYLYMLLSPSLSLFNPSPIVTSNPLIPPLSVNPLHCIQMNGRVRHCL